MPSTSNKFKPPAPNDEVWYVPSAGMPRGPRGTLEMGKLRGLPAIVTNVHTARLVDLEVTDAKGNAHRFNGITLLQDGDPHPQPLMGHAQWTKEPWPEHKPQSLPSVDGEQQSIGPGDVGDAGKLLGL
jgi:hypothetical protein